MAKEIEIEQSLINRLTDLKYTYRSDIRDKDALETNFRKKFELLNRVELTDSEFDRLLEEIIKPDVFESSKILRQPNSFIRDDSTPLHYTLVNIKDWCKNDFEIINQLRINTSNSHQRYDVIILINGIPVVQIELKSLDIRPNKAIEQIIEYKSNRGSGYANSLLCFMQLFIVSNQSNTYYFANNDSKHFSFNAEEQFLPVYHFAEKDNKKITHLDDFTDKFLPKCKLGEMISRYMVLVAVEKKILVMRPYQIYAVEAIVDCIQQNRGNGYIWHTTGSGKTLTSFKTAVLLKDNTDIDKCLFVVDRKDLDRQTREEFNKFQEGCVEENTNTHSLVQKLISDDYADKVIVTTIQKLGLALDEDSNISKKRIEKGKISYKAQLEPLRNKRIAIIFDECHRSQFGENHNAIKEFFPKAQLFGFTGTPIFAENAAYKKIDGQEASYQITEDIFQKLLHSYTITHAIEDRNVLRFHIDYFKPEGNGVLSPGEGIARPAVVEAVLNKHDAATYHRRFNAVLATASISDAVHYYHLFNEAQAKRSAENNEYVPLNIACVFSPPIIPNADGSTPRNNIDVKQLQEDLPQEAVDNKINPKEKKEALELIIANYNKQYKTNHSINEFDSYYQDVQQRIKFHKFSNADHPHENKIDIVIVVDMLLTGFDSKYLNTLYVDKNLKYHGLIQAFSRTNRILNETKPYGNILDFRQLENEIDKAIALFSGENSSVAKEIWLVDPAPAAIEKFKEAYAALDDFMQKNNLPCKPQEVFNLKGDAARIDFINRFKEVQRLKTQLDQYTELTKEQKQEIKSLIPEDDFRSFRSSYLEIASKLKEVQQKAVAGNNVPLQQLDFEFVLFASVLIDYDYIMKLIAQSTKIEPGKTTMRREKLADMLKSSANLMDEKDDILKYIYTLEIGKALDEKDIKEGYQAFKSAAREREIEDISQKYGLAPGELKSFVDHTIYRMIFDAEKLNDLMAPLNLGWKDRTKKELELMDDLLPLFKKLAQGREISGLGAYENE